MTTPHQPENGYENATDEEKKTMMLKIAKDANAEQKAMFEPEKQPWKLIREDQVNQTWRHEDKGERLINKELLSFILKEEQCCLCKDKGVIELIEEAVEAERARIRKRVEGLKKQNGETVVHIGNVENIFKNTTYNIALSDALQVINKEATDYDTALAEVKEITKTALDKIETDHFNVINKKEIPRNPLDQNKWM